MILGDFLAVDALVYDSCNKFISEHGECFVERGDYKDVAGVETLWNKAGEGTQRNHGLSSSLRDAFGILNIAVG